MWQYITSNVNAKISGEEEVKKLSREQQDLRTMMAVLQAKDPAVVN